MVCRLLRLSVWVCLFLCAGATLGADDKEPYWNARPLSYWLRALTTSDPLAREQGANSVREIAIVHGGGVVAPAVPLLLPNLSHGAPGVRESTAAALEQIGPAAEPAVPQLLGLLSTDPAPGVRSKAALALARIAPQDLPVVEAVTAALRADADPGVRLAAAVVLVASGPAAAPALPVLRDTFDAPPVDSGLRLFVSAALAQAGDHERGLRGVRHALDADDPGIRAEAAGLLAAVAPADAETLPALIAALEDDAPQVRSAAADALGAIGRRAKAALPALWSMLRDRDYGVREHVLEAIRRIKG